MEQLRLVPGLDPDSLVVEAKIKWKPIKTFCMFSGGNDSMVVAHRCRKHYDALFHIDTRTGVEEPGLSVRDHIERMAAFLGKPLVVIDAGDAYEKMVLGGHVFSRGDKVGQPEQGHGFPGPGMHGKAYTRLKERQIEELLRRSKEGFPRSASILLISGIHRAESKRRAKRMPLTQKGAAKFVNPLIDWTPVQFREYREANSLPESDVAALLHRSGECNCGAYANAGEERSMLEQFCPRTFAKIVDLEQRAEAAGIRWCRWGGYDVNGTRSTEKSAEKVGLICDSCSRDAALF